MINDAINRKIQDDDAAELEKSNPDLHRLIVEHVKEDAYTLKRLLDWTHYMVSQRTREQAINAARSLYRKHTPCACFEIPEDNDLCPVHGKK